MIFFALEYVYSMNMVRIVLRTDQVRVKGRKMKVIVLRTDDEG